MTKVSVIIPVYNTEKYLERCLANVCSQTLSDIEILCINDCSTDNSSAVLHMYAQKDTRINYIDFDNNKGVANEKKIRIVENPTDELVYINPQREFRITNEATLATQNISQGQNNKQLKNILSAYPEILERLKN